MSASGVWERARVNECPVSLVRRARAPVRDAMCVTRRRLYLHGNQLSSVADDGVRCAGDPMCFAFIRRLLELYTNQLTKIAGVKFPASLE